MSRTVVIILVIVAFGLGVGAGTLGILYSTGRLTEESSDIQEIAPTLSLNDPTPTPNQLSRIEGSLNELAEQVNRLATQVAADAAGVNEQIVMLSTAVAGVEVQAVVTAAETDAVVPTQTPTEAAAETEMPEATEAASQGDAAGEDTAAVEGPARALFRINPDESQARFMIDEVLGGNPTTVVGSTRRVAGDIIVNFEAPASSQIGEIVINARTFRTDNEFRDQSIRGQILETDTYEFVTFTPQELSGMPAERPAVGETITFQIMGDLTIKDVTRSVTFDATVTLVSAEQISGTARLQALYSDFGITINPPPTVADISDELVLEIEFVADLIEAA